MVQRLKPAAESLYGFPQPTQSNLLAPIIAKRAPATTDTGYSLGQPWVDKVGANAYQLVQVAAGAATWAVLGGSTSAVATINSLSPAGGNIVIAGTANQITATSAASTVTLSLPSTVIAPGSVAATTTLTATLGAITATNGNLVLGTAGNKLSIATGANASVGTTAAMTGSPGTVTVTSTAVTTSSVILFARDTVGGTAGQVSISAQSAGSFTLLSTGNETSTFNYLIIN
jgi:hypothetical protein